MSQMAILARWRSAVMQAARLTLKARWRSTFEALARARSEYAALRAAAAIDVRAMRKAAQRVHDLEQMRAVLAHQLVSGG
jgi:hypothetical protein